MVSRFFILISVIFTIYFGQTFSTKTINEATFEELDSILGIGRVKAESIIKERDKSPYKNLDDFKQRHKGKIGEVVINRMVKKFKF